MLHYLYLATIISLLFPSFVGLPFVPSSYIFAIGAIVSTVCMKPKVLFSKALLSCSITLLMAHVIYLIAEVYDLDARRKLSDFFVPYWFTFILLNFYQNMSKKRVLMIKLFVVGAAITALTTIIGNIQSPSASKVLSGALGNTGETSLLTRAYMLKGIADYSMSLVWMISAVLLAYLFKKRKQYRVNTLLVALLLLLCVFTLFQMGFTTPFLLMIIAIIVLPFMRSLMDFRKALATSIFASLSAPVLIIIISFSLYQIADILNSPNISPRMENIAMRMDGSLKATDTRIDDDLLLEAENKYLGSYELRLARSIESFFSSPYIGGRRSGGHNFYFDLLAQYGIFGFAVIILIIRNLYKMAFHSLRNEELKIVYKYVFLFFIILGLVKTYALLSFFVFIFFIVPSILNFLSSRYQRENILG